MGGRIYRNGRFQEFGPGQGFPGTSVFSIFEPAPGRILATSRTSLAEFDGRQRRVQLRSNRPTDPTTRRFGGTGLGLAISARLVGLMHGRIRAESPWHDTRTGQEIRGSAFHFTARFGRGKPPQPEARRDAPETRPLRIPVVEDNAVNQMLVSRLLEKMGHSIMLAGDGRDALELLKREPVDAILMGVQMPGIDGFEATGAIRRKEQTSGRHVPIIGVTAHALRRDRERCLEAGMDAYLAKPIRPGELRRALADAVSARQERNCAAARNRACSGIAHRYMLADDRMNTEKRRIPLGTYLFFFVVFGMVLLLLHTPLLNLPYFWDELGQFVPAALDILRAGAWIPHSATPNAHPPGVMAYLAGFWFAVGYSIVATRVAMLLVAAAGLLVSFLLAIRLSANLPGKPAFAVVLFLIVSPLYYAQSMLALLDLPAMLFTCLALLFFLQKRTLAAAVACVALVMVKETGILVPAVLGAWLVWERRWREAAYFVAPFLALFAWILALKLHTGHFLGNRQFARRNLLFLLHPVRFPLALFRRLYYLFFADFHWIGTAAIVWAARCSRVFRNRDWGVAATVAAAHVLFFSLFGWATLERYLLPVLPILYCAMIAAFSTLPRHWSLAGQIALIFGLAASNFWNPPYPFPLENNLAFVDSVELQKEAAEFIQFTYPGQRVLTTWPLGSALTHTAYGYVEHALASDEIPDFRAATLERVDWSKVGVFVLYSRDWEPKRNVLHIPLVRRLWERYYSYQPDLAAPASQTDLTLELAGHWERRGQWVDVYAAVRTRSNGSMIVTNLPEPLGLPRPLTDK